MSSPHYHRQHLNVKVASPFVSGLNVKVASPFVSGLYVKVASPFVSGLKKWRRQRLKYISVAACEQEDRKN